MRALCGLCRVPHRRRRRARTGGPATHRQFPMYWVLLAHIFSNGGRDLTSLTYGWAPLGRPAACTARSWPLAVSSGSSCPRTSTHSRGSGPLPGHLSYRAPFRAVRRSDRHPLSPSSLRHHGPGQAGALPARQAQACTMAHRHPDHPGSGLLSSRRAGGSDSGDQALGVLPTSEESFSRRVRVATETTDQNKGSVSETRRCRGGTTTKYPRRPSTYRCCAQILLRQQGTVHIWAAAPGGGGPGR